MTLPTYEEDDRIEVRGNEYVVETVDVLPKRDHPFQYRLDPVDDGPGGILKPVPDGGVFVLSEYHEVGPDDVDVVSGDEQ